MPYCTYNLCRKPTAICFHELGVPQESILGPLIYLTYINDLSKSEPELRYILFANNTITFSADSQPHLSIITLVNKWCQAIKLVINYTVLNTRQVIFQDSKKTVNLEETLNMGQSLLEINIETSINFKSHLKSLRKKNLNFL